MNDKAPQTSLPDLLRESREASRQLKAIASVANRLPKRYAAQILPIIRWSELDDAILNAQPILEDRERDEAIAEIDTRRVYGIGLEDA